MSFITKIQEFVKEKLASLKSKKAAPAEETAVPAPAEETVAAEPATEEAAKPVAASAPVL